MITSPHFHVQKIFIVFMFAACLPTNIKYCYAVEDASDNAIAPPPKRFVCPIKFPELKFPELKFPELKWPESWPRFALNKVGTESLNGTIDPIIPQDSLPPKPEGNTCDNSPEVIIKIKPSCSKTEESEFDEPNPTSFLIAVEKSESFKKLGLDGMGSFVEHKEGPFYDSAPIPLRLNVRQMYEKVRITIPEDNLSYKTPIQL